MAWRESSLKLHLWGWFGGWVNFQYKTTVLQAFYKHVLISKYSLGSPPVLVILFLHFLNSPAWVVGVSCVSVVSWADDQTWLWAKLFLMVIASFRNLHNTEITNGRKIILEFEIYLSASKMLSLLPYYKFAPVIFFFPFSSFLHFLFSVSLFFFFLSSFKVEMLYWTKETN